MLCDVQEMGVGLAEFHEGGKVTYHNLWLPARFPLLFVYVARERGNLEELKADFGSSTLCKECTYGS